MKRFPVAAIFVCVVLLASRDTYAEERSISFAEALRLAAQKPVQTVVAKERVSEALAQMAQANSVFFPKVQASVSQNRQTKNLSSMGIELPGQSEQVTGPFNTFDARLRLAQKVLDAADIQRLAAVRDGEDMSKAELRKAKNDAIALCASFYVEAMRAHQKLILARERVARDIQFLRIAHRSFRSGKTDAVRLRRTRTVLLESYFNAAQALRDEWDKRLDLAVALGFPEREAPLPDAVETFRAMSVLSNEELTALLDKHPDLEAARAALKQKEAVRQSYWMEYLPKLGVSADIGYNGNEPNDAQSTYGFGVEASMPLFDAGERAGKANEADARVRQSRAMLENTRARVHARLIKAAENLKASEALLKAGDLAALMSEKEYRVTQLSRSNGSASEQALAEAHFNRSTAQDQRSQAAAEYLLAQVELLHAQGRIEDLAGPPGEIKNV